MLKQIIISLIVAASFTTTLHAQTSRRTIEKYSTEAVKQIELSGRTPTVDILDSLANNAEVSIEMISRMGEPDDTRQQRAIKKLIDAIVDYSQTDTGRRYTDVVRSGLKKALDRSYDTDMQLHVMEQWARCAKPADAAHIAMYLEVPELSSTAHNILANMKGIDNNIAEAAASQPGIKAKVQNILDIHSGKTAQAAPAAPATSPKPAAIPFWTEGLGRAIEETADKSPSDIATIIIGNSPEKATETIIGRAAKESGATRNAILARCLTLVDKANMTNEARYLLLRQIDEIASDDILRQQIIVSLGRTGTIQALVYLRKYAANATLADALATATADIIAAHPEVNGGRMIYSLLYAAKQSFIRHYDEQGVDSRIDQVLAAIDNWRADAGYNLSHTEETRMETRGFWVMHDEMADFDMTFDWRAAGSLTVSLHSMPVLTLDCSKGARIDGDNTWHKFNVNGEWCTANVSVRGNRVTVIVNGETVIDGAQLVNSVPGENANKSGCVKFLADDNGATIRQYCFTRKN